MPTPAINLEARINALNSVLPTHDDRHMVGETLKTCQGDWAQARKTLSSTLSPESLQKVDLAHELAVWSDDHASLVMSLCAQPHITNLRDVALRYGVKDLATLVSPDEVPESAAGSTADEKAKNYAADLHNKLFTAEPTAVIQRMVQMADVPIANKNHREGVDRFLTNQPDFNIRTTSVYKALKSEDAFKGIEEEHRTGVAEQLKILQRVQAISPMPAAIPHLMNAGLTSAFRVAEMPESTFLAAHGTTLGEPAAKQIYTNAINSHIRNEHALMTMRESWRGTGIGIIDGQEPKESRMARMQGMAEAVQLNLETLFGSIDYCECDDCQSVYSPAAYFVEILQYLRNNNLGPDPRNPASPNPGIRTDPKDISNTPLEKLFRRRPDLGCLELTCDNTFTVLPYIDLVNEVMESFVVHLDQYAADKNTPKQALLEVFDVEGEASSELLAQPQHINYDAYCILKHAVYPFTLPYHQPIDAARIYLNHLGTSRAEVMDMFRENTSAASGASPEQLERAALQRLLQDRAVDAEALGLTQEEYIILTHEAFWPREYFEYPDGLVYSIEDYQKLIKVRPVHEYFGYGTEGDMLSQDEKPPIGITFVEKQFLPRTGIRYEDLVELLKTRFINPAYPEGTALTLLEGIQYSYRFLQTMVNAGSANLDVRFAKLIEFLNSPQPLAPKIAAMMHPDPCHHKNPEPRLPQTDLRNWVYCHFDRIGKLIVLESGEGQQLAIEGQLQTDSAQPTFIGTLRKDGTIVDKDGHQIGNVPAQGPLRTPDGRPFLASFGVDYLNIKNATGNTIGFVDNRGLRGLREERLTWSSARDTCDLDKVRLVHLDGTTLTTAEYDRMQRFIRLWHKLGWTIRETDLALIGSADPARGSNASSAGGPLALDMFQSECGDESGVNTPNTQYNANCPDIDKALPSITTGFLHEMVAIRKLLDLTGLPLDKLLSFWADISTSGERSLYSRLFLTHNMLGIDKVFRSDANGNFLTQDSKLTDHIPALMASLKLKADDLTAIMKLGKLDDALTLSNVSYLYRHSLLAKALHVKADELAGLMELFGDVFASAQQTLVLFQTWGLLEGSGFTLRQLNYIIHNRDNPLHPLAPTKRTILQVSKVLYDGLKTIAKDHRDLTDATKDDATTDMVRAEAGLLFDQGVVDQIVSLLEGTTVYATNAPIGLSIVIPKPPSPAETKVHATLAKKLKYSGDSLQVTGILTDAEKTLAASLSRNLLWLPALDRIGKQRWNFFNDALQGIFPNQSAKYEAGKNLLVGDDNYVDESSKPPAVTNTALDKRFYFLTHFLPCLRRELARRFIVETLSGVASLTPDVTRVLLADVLVSGTPSQPAMYAIEKLAEKPEGDTTDWTGYLIPPADGYYTFVATVATSETEPALLLLDGAKIKFEIQQEDPSNVWSTDPDRPVKLKGGHLYWFVVPTSINEPSHPLQWKTGISPRSAIPSASLLPDYSALGTGKIFDKLKKAALLINGFGLNAEEVSYFQANAADFADDQGNAFDLNAISLGHWRRLQAYASLRKGFPKTESTLLDLFKWAAQATDASKLSVKIAEVTQWKSERIAQCLTASHFGLERPEAFRNEINLIKLKSALAVADKIQMDLDRLFQWAKPISKFWDCLAISEDIRKAVRARYDQTEWEQVVKPLNNLLRENQKQALISYLLVQKDLIDWGVVDADSLFEFFLIDVQMDACMETSRIKQAISSVQLFVQRCMLGLEERYGVRTDVLDRGRWEWMQTYRVWEANRKIFLYPENWIKPELRDDKSPFYKELESELLQKDLNTQTISDAMKNYVFKVDEVANLKVVGVFLEADSKLHIFGRTRNAPYSFHYRYFDIRKRNWYPWEKMQIDIPSYDVEGPGASKDHGTYVVPVVWDSRLLVFFPQFVKKTQPAVLTLETDTAPEGKVSSTEATAWAERLNLSDSEKSALQLLRNSKQTTFWEIRLAWSEYRNRKWTQKQISADVAYVTSGNLKEDLLKGSFQGRPPFGASGTFVWRLNYRDAPPVSKYQIVPRIGQSQQTRLVIDLYQNLESTARFHFQGSQIVRVEHGNGLPALSTEPTDFQYQSSPVVGDNNLEIHSFQATDSDPPSLLSKVPFFVEEPDRVVATYKNGEPIIFSHPFAHELLGKVTSEGLDDLFDYFRLIAPTKGDAFGSDAAPTLYDELKSPYSLSSWETAFHVPMMLAENALVSNRFEPALTMCHNVLTPFAKGSGNKRFWRFFPFTQIDAANTLEKLFLGLQSNQPSPFIDEWRDRPFNPHGVARKRPSAYMKWVAMTYIKIWIAYGDYYFRQNTLEKIPLAIQCYVIASHCFGPLKQRQPKSGETLPQTYNSLLDGWNAFGNAMVELELAFPFSSQTPLPIGASNGVFGLPNVFGFASSLYFCIPDNPQLRALRDTIDDRLFKIRHCEDIDGVVRHLPLFEPPIDPALLVQAAAQGLSLSSVLSDLNSPMPNYRFSYLLQKALELCSEVRALGNAFLSAKEKGDAEALSLLRAGHESSIHNLVLEIRNFQLAESEKALDALLRSRKAPEYRLGHFFKLTGQDQSTVPNGDAEFAEIPDPIEPPIGDSGLMLSKHEKEEMDKASEARDSQLAPGIVETLASTLHVLPVVETNASPLGVGISVAVGGTMLGNAAQAVARGLQIHSNELSFQSTNSGRKAGIIRLLQDRVQQANVAGHEMKSIDKQMLTQQIRINIAQQEIANQQKQIDNAQEMEEFLRNKYTKQELYVWMDSQVRALYHQAYNLAFDLATRAEKAFRFERGLSTSNFIQYGYWDAAYDGLYSGERLYIGLKQLEAAYQEKRGHDFEITKSISLRQVNPLALIQLKETGRCEFALPEILFDMDYPGHYMRRLKTVSLRIPCTIGPHTSLNCTLRLLEHKFRTNTKETNKYPEQTDQETDDRFSTVNVPISSIAVSSLEDESGVFELNFHDERYLPFEGAGAISKWRLELPADFRQFDYDTITDVVMRLRYTSVDGGDKLKGAAAAFVQDYIGKVEDLSREEGLFAVFDLKNDFPGEWYAATHPAAGADERVLTITKLNEKLPVFTKGHKSEKILAKDISIYMSPLASLSVFGGEEEIIFEPGDNVGTMKTFVASDVSQSFDSLKITIKDTKTVIDKMWLMVRYVLG